MKFLVLSFLVFSSAWAFPTKYQQFNSSLKVVLKNSTMPDVFPGMVVASPSKSDPDYYFDWVRDTALTKRSFVDFYELTKNASVKKLLMTWVDAEIYRQNLPSLSGLGEPKYNVNGSAFSGPWGRPQNDGPALRAITMIKFARILMKEGEGDLVLKKFYHGVLPADSVIKKDLEYTAHHWRESSFDLWEEERGMHFYTLLAQHTALSEGAKLAEEFKDMGAASFYKEQSDLIAKKLRSEFVDDKIGIVVTRDKTAALWYKNSGLDVAPLLALNHNSPYQKVFSFREPAVKKYIQALIKNSKEIYTINKRFPDLGVAIGRYQEDRYDGYRTESVGNPWFLSTIALAEYYCLLRNEVNSKDLEDAIEAQFDRVLFHSDRAGRLSEQFNRESGKMQGARDLTWSHSAFMTAMMRCGFIAQNLGSQNF